MSSQSKNTSSKFVPMHCFHVQERTSAFEVKMTPELADFLLSEFNMKNRDISRSTVDQYVRMMKKGQWIDGLVDIVVGKCGNILNGQQTLTAIKESGVPIVVTIKVGYDDAAINVLDTNRPRSVKDVLAIQGKNSSEIGVKITSNLTRLANGWKSKPSMPDLVNTAIKQQKVIRRLTEILGESPRERYRTRGGFLAAMAIYHVKNPAEAEAFLRDVIDDNPANFVARKLTMNYYTSSGKHPGNFGKKDYEKAVEAIHVHHFKKTCPKSLVGFSEWEF